MSKLRMKSTAVVILLLIAALSMGCTEQPLDTPASVFVEEPEVPEFDIKITRVYSDDTEYTRVVYSIENTGDVAVTWLKVSVYLLNADGDLIAAETHYPSGYSDYGLKPGQIIYEDGIFNPSQGHGCASGGVKILDYKVS